MPKSRPFLLVAAAGRAPADRVGIIASIESQGLSYVVGGAMVLARLAPAVRRASRRIAA